MKHGLVSVSGYDFFSQYDLSFCDLVDEADKLAVDKAWNALMGSRGNIEATIPTILEICSRCGDRH